MIFGNKSIVAFEVKDCQPPCLITKDVFWWINNDRIGNGGAHFSSYVCAAENFLHRLEKENLYFHELENKDDKEIFNLLKTILSDNSCYLSLNYSKVYSLLLIAHWDDALDYWDFYICEEKEFYRLIWSKANTDNVQSFRVKKDELKDTLKKFITYSNQQLVKI